CSSRSPRPVPRCCGSRAYHDGRADRPAAQRRELGSSMRLLVVEDEEDLAEALRVGLTRAGYAVDIAADAAQAYERVTVNAYDLMLLDVNLPDTDGFTLCGQIRRGEVPVAGGDLRVLMLTARGTLPDRVRGLDE